MESTAVANSESPTLAPDMEQLSENTVPHNSNHEYEEHKVDFSSEEIRGIMGVIAATGKFWHDWSLLKNLLSSRLKQVLAEYPEAQTGGGVGSQQSLLSDESETYSELVRRLDEALLSFIEGPPFTLQRLCEILLSPKSTYSNLSKLALALEKNLLVTSTLTKCTDPYPTAPGQITDDTDKESEGPPNEHSNPVPNGVENAGGDGDEEMTDAEPDGDGNSTNPDTEMQEQKDSSEALDGDSEIVSNSAPPTETDTTSEQCSVSEKP
ncbi:serine/threonine-protein phosphatase 4 regulatory subunit 2 [Ananas comosus]|uniref:Serine/threonine-protein phosphatase 4 regulatory subunit 2 n=1 Tax=Ananas comosus TaxID=4615 RepID=A0A6P5FDB9_ANACO|nr:serine/threonine-protein phosphatase 4 regulatory subunit 2 [Ananas comosus]